MRLSFRRNLGNRDRAVRGLIGLSAFLLAVFRSAVITRPISIVLLVIGIPLIVEAVAGY
ncbi:MAG: YgaP-like transmembrane domain [Syntrophomonadales bacterium]